MRVRLVCLEDGIMSCGFRKMAAYSRRLHPDTYVHYVTTGNIRSLLYLLMGRTGTATELEFAAIDEIAAGLEDADLIGFSSMTGYSALTKAIIRRLRERGSRAVLLWGGIHPIIHPEDAIASDVDAICTGEGELPYEEFLAALKQGRDYSAIKNMWFHRDGEVIKNGFRPLMTAEEMDTLPLPVYADNELIYKRGRGFVPMGTADYLHANGLSYNTVWSIGCPFHCTYCGNTKFIANDPMYKKIRHPSPRFAVAEVKAALARHPHIGTVCFHDDSFLAIPYAQLEEFATAWHSEVKVPFAMYGVIPNYVRRDKIELLTWAGMNRMRMGVQSGSERILSFYKRPTPVEKVERAAEICGSFAPVYHIPPAYDFIVDNPIETRQDVVDSLELAFRLRRPFTMNIFSLKVIPNTQMAADMEREGLDLDEIDEAYNNIPPRAANLILYLLTVWRPPRWLFDRMLVHVEASATPQPLYPVLGIVLRFAHLARRAIDHLRHMDFSTIPGFTGYVLARSGFIGLWLRLTGKHFPRPSPRHVAQPESTTT